MKRLHLVLLAMCIFVTPAMAKQTVYLKEGGTIEAKSVWRAKGKVHVLVNRDTLTEFATSEIDLKRTFANKRRVIRKNTPAPGDPNTAAVSPAGTPVNSKSGSAKAGTQLPSPKIIEGKPESPVPKGEEGTIRKHKKEMTERLGE